MVVVFKMETVKSTHSLNRDYSTDCDFQSRWDSNGNKIHGRGRGRGNPVKTTQKLLHSVTVCCWYYWHGIRVN